MMKSEGSIWRKWDLHVHTPASFEWRGGKKLNEMSPDEQEITWSNVITKMNSLDIDAFCIMDYWTLDGYLSLRSYISLHPDITTKRIFPGIELRLEAPTHFRLNTHVLFDDSIDAESLRHFIAHLNIGDPSGVPPSRKNFIELGRSYDNGKLKKHGCKPEDKDDDDKMYDLGVKTALATRESLEKAMSVVGEERCLIVQPYETSDGLEGLDWELHPYDDSYLMKLADIFETRQSGYVDLFLGRGLSSKPSLGPEFIHNLGGSPKPVVSGSDAHQISKYGEYPSGRITWLKAQPTFSGLRQICFEPALRCFIGGRPPKLLHIESNKTKYIQNIALKKVQGSSLLEHWFDGVSIDLNPGLIAIIGNKGTGKSALADIIALAANTHCAEMEFLTSKRFRLGVNKAKHFQARLRWADGTCTDINLDSSPSSESPERVRYLPQQYIEKLCNATPGGGDEFERELKKVIFSHVPLDQRLNKNNLDSLIEYATESHRTSITQLRNRVHVLNGEILTVEAELAPEAVKSHWATLSLKQAELDSFEKSRPAVVQQPLAETQTPQERIAAEELKNAQQLFVEQNTTLGLKRSERTNLVTRKALLARIAGHVDNAERFFSTFSEQVRQDFEDAGFVLSDIIRLVVDRNVIQSTEEQIINRLGEIAVDIMGKDAIKGLEAQISDSQRQIVVLQTALDARQQSYQAYLTELAHWESLRLKIVGDADTPDTIEYIKYRIKSIEDVLPKKLADLREQRWHVSRAIHKELLNIRKVYQDFYNPVQLFAGQMSTFTSDPIQLHFDAFLAATGFADSFLEFIHRNKKGNFYGDDESKKAIDDIAASHDFNETDGIVGFLSDLMTALTRVERSGTLEELSVQSQLKTNKKISDFYDFLFGFSYLEPRYTLKLGDKDISQLSPGEKGALLLVFYLLLDSEQIPIIIDQPEQNLDNESVVKLLVDCIREARSRRQVIIVTHNPNLAIVCDADQLICCHLDKSDGNRITYDSGAIEDNLINRTAVDVLEGTYRAFDNRRKKYHKPIA